ncbi:NUDIX hydrolase [Halobacteriales archaeon QS_4_70_19]|jgi:8-oxo-dGTP diphosphatase|nr:MAG: NUDIX hydrolase [Halobacteriales archaeon QS_4_70_19]
MALDDLWYLADEADQRAEQAYHRLRERHDGFIERRREKRVSRRRFRTLAGRIRDSGAPYGAHTIVYRPSGDLLLVRHDAVDMWVLPGGEVDPGESFHGTARRELAEEAGVEVSYEGLGVLGRVEVSAGSYDTWGVLPVYAARASAEATPRVRDPDGEISEARWFTELPEDTRDRDILREWRRRWLD